MDKRNTPKSDSLKTRIITQLPSLAPLLLLLYVLISLGLAGLVGAYLVADIPLRLFFIDPVAEFNSPMYIGFVSNFGVLLWGAAASVCLFGGWLVLTGKQEPKIAWFLIFAGMISGMLMLDDLYLLHEEVIEDHLGISQKYVFAAYGLMVLGLFSWYHKIVYQSDFVLLGLAFIFFAGSVFVDLFITPEEFFIFGNFPGRHLIEDGLKLFGIATWSFYLVRTSAQLVAPLVRTPSPSDVPTP